MQAVLGDMEEATAANCEGLRNLSGFDVCLFHPRGDVRKKTPITGAGASWASSSALIVRGRRGRARNENGAGDGGGQPGSGLTPPAMRGEGCVPASSEGFACTRIGGLGARRSERRQYSHDAKDGFTGDRNKILGRTAGVCVLPCWDRAHQEHSCAIVLTLLIADILGRG